MKSLIFSLMGALAISASSASLAAAHGGYRVVWDDFRQGFTADTPSAKWLHFGVGPFVADDGIETTSPCGGLWVSATGEHPLTHAPAFVKTMGWEDGTLSTFDHVKWLVIMNHFSSKGEVGFDAVPGRELVCQATVSGRIFGTLGHPFGSAVQNPSSDPRLAAVATSAFDPETFVIFNFLLTNTMIYAMYERAPFARTPTDDYASFIYAVPVATRWVFQEHNLQIAFDKSGGKVRWIIDGIEVFRVKKIGSRINRTHMLLDRGGDDTIVSPDQLDCGMGMFTFLDGYGPTNRGLVQIDEDESTYFHPLFGEPHQVGFVDPYSVEGNRLFGQGASMHVEEYVVASRPVSCP